MGCQNLRTADKFRQAYPSFFQHLIRTGTAAVGCIAGAFTAHLDVLCQHSLTPVYVNNGLTASAIGFYADLARSAAFERFGAAPEPYLLLKTGSGPEESCFDTADMTREALTVRHSSTHSMRPGRRCPGSCPCHEGVSNCLQIGSCFASEPLASLFWVHVIRRPLDVVLSAYAYHTQDPAPEAWLHEQQITHYARFLASQGADNASLQQLGCFDPALSRVSYWSYLRSLPEPQGLLLEFLRSSAEMWRMARLHLRLSRLPAGRSEVVRYEALQADPSLALSRVLQAVATPCSLRHRGQLQAGLLRACHTPSWSAAKRGNSSHVGKYSAADRQRRVELLLSNGIARDHLLRLESMLGYEPDEQFAAFLS